MNVARSANTATLITFTATSRASQRNPGDFL